MESRRSPVEGPTGERGRTGRRQVLRLAAQGTAALAGAAALATGSGGDARADDEQLTGSWLVAATPAGAPAAPARVLVSFTGDGVALRTAPVRQAAPAALGVAQMVIGTTHGAWARAGDRAYALTFVGLAFDEAGKFLATQRIRVTVELDRTRDAFSGPFRTDFIAADGHVLASSTGTVHGARIGVEPLG